MTPKCRFCNVPISIIRGRGMQCPKCYAEECVRMAGEMGTAVNALIPCVFNVRGLRECSWELHHVKSFARYAWQYASQALVAQAEG